MLRRWNLRKAACVWTIAVTALGCGMFASAGTNDLTLVGPHGGHIYKVLRHPTLPLYAYALTQGGYYWSPNGGVSWGLIGWELSNAPADLAVDPNDANHIIFAVPGESPVVSTDKGFTLNHAGNFPIVPAGLNQVEFSADGSVVYAASGVRIFRSTDSGRNWSERTAVTANTASNLQFLRVNPLDAHVVYVYDLNDGGFRSTNGGDSWQPIPMPANTVDVAITSTSPQKIWAASPSTGVHQSSDGGASWPVVLPGAALSIALDPQNQSVVYAGTSPDGLMRTADGTSWSNVQGNARIGQINSIAVDPQDSAKVMLGGVSGIVLGTPATAGVGGVWERRDPNIYATTGGDLSAPSGSDRVYFNAVNNGVHFLVDDAVLAAPVNNEAIDPFQPAVVTASTFGLLAQARGPDRLFVGISGGYVRSDDAGNTWRAGTVGSSNTVLHFADSPGNPDLILASTFPGMHRSIDGGDTWMSVTAGLPTQPQATALLFATAAPNTVYAGIQSGGGSCCIQHGVYRSSDGGATWTAANTGFTASEIRQLAIDPTNAQIVYAAANAEGLLKTTNGGASWSRLTWPNGQSNTLSVAVDPQVPNIVYVGSANRVARSVDSGLTWQEALAGDRTTPFWQANALLAHPRSASTLLLSTSSQGVAEFTFAPDLKVGAADGSSGPVLHIGAQATYPYEIFNFGPFHATGVRFVATLPDATGISATTTQGTCSVQGTTVTCAVGLLEQAARMNITLKATHPVAGTAQVLWSVSGDQPDGDSTDNAGVSSTKIEAQADIAVTVSGPTSALAGSAVTYTYTATNLGPNDSSGVTANITLSTGMSVPTVTTTRGTCTVTRLVVDCVLGDIPNGGAATITVNSAMPATQLNVVQLGARFETASTDLVLTNNNLFTRPDFIDPSPPPSGGGGGGGGGSSSVFWLLALAALRIVRSYARPRRLRISGVGPSNDAIATLPTYFRSFTPTGVV
jgi:uncharacterized repeat protein (TIGR01451 family)